MSSVLEIIKSFPDPSNFADTEKKWTDRHGTRCSLIDCASQEIYYPLHYTPLSVKCCFGGEEHYRLKGGRKYRVQDPYFLVLNEGAEYESYISYPTPVNSISINFTNDFIADWIQAQRPIDYQLHAGNTHSGAQSIYLVEKLCPQTANLMEWIQILRNSDQPLATDETLHRFFQFLVTDHQLHIRSSATISKVKSSTQIELYRRLHFAIDYIHSCFEEDLSLQQLSRIALLNPFYFLRTFKSFTGSTPHQYVINVRMDAAKRYLRSGFSPRATCLQIGFSDLSSFSKLFKKHTGYTPSQYAQEWQSHKV
jgi:AraC family transcriptional regulator